LGDNEFWLRVPTAIAGILAIFMIYVLGKYIYGSREGLITAAMTVVLWAPLYYSQEARAYSFLFLFSMVSVFYWLKIIHAYKVEQKAKLHWIVILIISGILSEYFQYLGLFLHILLGLTSVIIFIKRPKYILRMVIIFGVIALALVPWLPYALHQVSVGAEWIQKPKLLAFGYFLAFLFNLSPYVLGIAVILTSILLWQTIKSKFPKENFFMNKELFLFLWLVLPFTIIFIKSLVSKPALTYYSLIISAAPAYILFAKSITSIKIKQSYQNILALIIFGFISWQLIFDMNYYGQPYKDHFMVFGKKFKKRTKQMFREAAQYVQTNDEKYPNSLIAAYVWFPDYFNYYFEKNKFDKKVDLHILDIKDTVKFKDLSALKDKDFLWVIRGHKDIDTVLNDWLDNRFKLIHYEPMIGADVRLYQIE
jgi:uncharacterized membrane protein